MSEYKAAAQTLAEAFATDEVARYFIDTPDRTMWSAAKKWKLHVKILEYIVYAHCLKGMVLTAGEGYGCVALWWVVPFPGQLSFSSRLALPNPFPSRAISSIFIFSIQLHPSRLINEIRSRNI